MAVADAHDPEPGKGADAPAPGVEPDYFGDEARPIDPDVAARVLRKIDLFLMPAMVIGKAEGALSGLKK